MSERDIQSEESPLEPLPERTRQWLVEIGIETPTQLRVIGPAAAFEMLRELHPEASPGLLGQLRQAARRRPA